ncbi:MAG: hypothetical protein K5637_00980 [Lachnospiraceae bacterium]|nr:hypothetical protein [Lachnospiraceae bacterium]
MDEKKFKEELQDRIQDKSERLGEMVSQTAQKVIDTADELTEKVAKTAEGIIDKVDPATLSPEERKKAEKYYDLLHRYTYGKLPMMGSYVINLTFRAVVFIVAFIFYIQDRTVLYRLATQPIVEGITPIHLLWVVFMVLMVTHIFPNNRISMAVRKAEGSEYVPVKNYSEFELLKRVQRMNLGAWKVMLVWLLFNAIFGVLYLSGIIHEGDLMMLTVFYFLSDTICIVLFCPFQSFLMKNKCCVNCRIFDWGHFMMFTPMIFIRNFFSWSLFFTSMVVLIHWEIIYARHPERFWEGSNRRIQCVNCKDKMCRLKSGIAGGRHFIGEEKGPMDTHFPGENPEKTA